MAVGKLAGIKRGESDTNEVQNTRIVYDVFLPMKFLGGGLGYRDLHCATQRPQPDIICLEPTPHRSERMLLLILTPVHYHGIFQLSLGVYFNVLFRY